MPDNAGQALASVRWEGRAIADSSATALNQQGSHGKPRGRSRYVLSFRNERI